VLINISANAAAFPISVPSPANCAIEFKEDEVAATKASWLLNFASLIAFKLSKSCCLLAFDFSSASFSILSISALTAISFSICLNPISC